MQEVLRHKKGVCQDFTHLTIGCLRSLGLAARYVSGYLETLPPPGQEKLRGADASHAWFSVYLPGLAIGRLRCCRQSFPLFGGSELRTREARAAN